MAHGQSGAADVSRLAKRDGEVVFAELVEHPKGGADLADTFIVAAEGEKRISTLLIPARAYSAARSRPRRLKAVVETVMTARVGLSSPTAKRVRSARSTLRCAVRSSVT